MKELKTIELLANVGDSVLVVNRRRKGALETGTVQLAHTDWGTDGTAANQYYVLLDRRSKGDKYCRRVGYALHVMVGDEGIVENLSE